ncbi:hypothetical protein NST21_08825 [Peribacillus sp. FSL K6-1552]|uniref:hypothetical protein n=1 Tax=Peribacillus sp. FSL K6-1552 TaxID=2954514 RepID=UPI0030F978F5
MALAQALLTSDEPFVLLQSPSPLANMDAWVIDEDLERLSGNKKLIKEQFLPHIHAGLSEYEVVLGAVLQTFSSATDVEVVLNSILRDKRYRLLGIGKKTTMNGRTYEPQNYDIPFL